VNALDLSSSKSASPSLTTKARSLARNRRASPSFDLILVADCIWDRSLHVPLITSLLKLLEASPRALVHLTAGSHTGRKAVTDFLELAQLRGIVPQSPTACYEISVEGEKRGWEPEKGKSEEKQEERNRWTFVGIFELAK